MAEIPLSRGKVAVVDDKYFNWLNTWKWSFSPSLGYAHRSEGRKKQVMMHREVSGAQEGDTVDHINGNKLDNRQENLRRCTQRENSRNRVGWQKETTSAYKGVSWQPTREKWRATIKVDYKQKFLGYFDNEDEAALAYNEAARKHHGEFAKENNVPTESDRSRKGDYSGARR